MAACCSGAKPQRVRPQVIQVKQPTVVVYQGRISPQIAQQSTSAVKVKNLITARCPVCNIPMSVVNTAGRNVNKCVNPNCGYSHA